MPPRREMHCRSYRPPNPPRPHTKAAVSQIMARAPGRRIPGGEEKNLRLRCAERVRDLNLPNGKDLTIPALCEHLAQSRRHPLDVVTVPLPDGCPDGLLVETGTQDFIVLEQRLAPVHRRQVFFHEVGHLICGHQGSHPLPVSVIQKLLPSLSPDLVKRVLCRDHSQTEDEDEAEYTGSLIGRQVSNWAPQRTWHVPPDAQALVERLSVLEPPRR
ncbi:ImmA/IrrE family metallo-endopeptidase [Streptomyces sp. NPDC059037]|uniref:ImmA/IrrE family metallo-endopeptidase n=1 Tax=Streptomyces sp. NPDC059037 TaxID=3346710 RepID=UPI0036C53CBD